MTGTLDRLNGPCTWGTPTGPCGDTDSRPYKEGPRCDTHSPWARRGRPPPGPPPKPEQ